MKQIIQISLALMVLQAISTEALPTSAANPPPKDVILEFLLEKVYDMKSSTSFNFAASHTKLYKESLVVLQSLKDSGDKKYEKFDEQFFTDLKKDMTLFDELVEQLKKDKNNCDLQSDLSDRIWDLRVRTRENLHNEDIIVAWRKSDKDDQDFQFGKIDKTYAEIKEQLPAVIAKYKEGLSETDKQEFESELAQKPNIYAALSAMFQDKFNAANDGEGRCKNFGTRLVAQALERLAKN